MNEGFLGLSTMSLKKDINHLHDEILKDMRQMQSKLDIKYAKSDELLSQKITKFDLKIESFEKKITELSNLITIDNSLKEKIESLFQFKEETKDIIFKRRAKNAEFEKTVNDNINEINKILTNTVIYPTYIGKKAKFQTFHEFIDFVVQEITQLNLHKNKSLMDSFSSFKKKIDGVIETFKMQINNLIPKEVANQMLNELEDKINNTMKLYDDRLQDSRVENANYNIGIKKNLEEVYKQIDNLTKGQNYLNKSLKNSENYNTLSNEILEINVKINKIFDILKDLASFHPEVKKNYQIELERKPTKKIISGVKEYIKGNINANDLTSMKKFGFEKSKTKMIDKLSPNNPKTTQNIFDNNIMAEERLDFINKKFMNKKTINLSKQENTITSNKIVENEIIDYNRKNSFNFGKNTYFESSKVNSYIKKHSQNNKNFFNTQIGEKEHNIIEEENEINTHSINSISDKYKTSMKNEKNKEDFNIQKYNKKREDTLTLENIKINKNNGNINSIENKTLNSINNNTIYNDNKNINTNSSENNKETLIKSNNFYNNNINKEQTEKAKVIKHNIQTDLNYKNNNVKNNLISYTKEDFNKNQLSIASKFNPKILKINFQNIKKPSKSQSSESQRKNNKNQISEGNKVVMNYNYKPKNSDKSFSPITKKLYKTYSNFPKINHGNKNNTSNPSSRENVIKTIKEDKFYRKEPKATSFVKYKKKILFMNPDDLPFNYFEKTFENIFKNNLNLNLNKSERNNNRKINEINFFGKK